jgi:hypothetical protein
MCDSFWCDALANFVSDFVAGALLGSVLAWWIGRRLSKFEQSQQRKEEKRANIEKTIHYLELLKSEVCSRTAELPELIHTFETKTEIEQEVELSVGTPFWDALEPSGELPRLLTPQLLASLTQFYECLGFVKRVMSRFFPRTKAGIFGWTSFQKSSLRGLKEALKLGEDLPKKIESEIQNLRSELGVL